MNEEQLQAKCYQWFWNTYPEHRQMLFHVQQSAKNWIQGSRFKAIGVTSGVSDLVLILKNRIVFIELKVESGKQSPAQVTFQDKVETRGHQYSIVRTFEEFQFLIKKLL